MATRRDVEIGIDITGADDARIDVKKVEAAFEELGAETAVAATQITRGLDNIQGKFDKASRDMASVTQRDVNSMVKNFTTLESTIQKTFGDASKAPKELQEALAKAEAQVKEVTREFGKMDDAVKDNTANVKVAGDQWPGLGNAIEGVGGKAGTMAAKFGLVTAAFREGWQMGQELNQLFGTDMSEWDAAVARFGAGAKIIFAGVSDTIVDLARVTKEFWTFGDGWQDRVLNAYGDLEKTIKNNSNTFEDLSGAIDREITTKERSTEAAKKNAEAQREAEAAAKKLEAQKKRLADQINDVTKSLAEETAELNKQLGIAAASAGDIVSRSNDLEYFRRNLDAATEAVRAQATELETLSARYGEQDPLVTAAREKLNILEASLKSATQRYDETSREVETYKNKHEDANQAVESLRERIAELQKKHYEHENDLKNVGAAASSAATNTEAAASATENVGAAADRAHPKLIIFKDEAGRTVIQTDNLKESTKQVAENIASVAEAAEPAAVAVKAVATAAADLRSAGVREVDELTEAMKRLRDMTRETIDAMRDLAAVSGDTEEGGADEESPETFGGVKKIYREGTT